MSRFRGAVIGCGRMGAFTSESMLKWAPYCWHPLSHCEAIAQTPDIDLIAVCDTDLSRAERVKSYYPRVSIHRDYRELINSVSPDILGIATRTPERTNLIEFAAAEGVRGLHIEKPLCNKMAELKILERVFDSPNLICTYGTLRRYIPIFSYARELVRSKRFGQLEEIQVCFGSASLMWTHPHSFDILSFFADDAEVIAVAARLNEIGMKQNGAYFDGDPIVKSVTVEFANGVTGLISQMGGNDIVLSCCHGTVIIESGGRRIRCRESTGGGDPYWEKSRVEPFSEEFGGTRLAIERLVKGIRNPTLDQVAHDKNTILVGQRMLFASLQSHLEGGKLVYPQNIDPMLGISGKNIQNQHA